MTLFLSFHFSTSFYVILYVNRNTYVGNWLNDPTPSKYHCLLWIPTLGYHRNAILHSNANKYVLNFYSISRIHWSTHVYSNDFYFRRTKTRAIRLTPLQIARLGPLNSRKCRYRCCTNGRYKGSATKVHDYSLDWSLFCRKNSTTFCGVESENINSEEGGFAILSF